MTEPQLPESNSTRATRARWLPRIAAGLFGAAVLVALQPTVIPAPVFFFVLCVLGAAGFSVAGLYYVVSQAVQEAKLRPLPIGYRLISAAISGLRVLTAIALLGLAILLSFIFPFLFDDPRGNPFLVAAVACAVIVSIPASFILSASPYKWAKANRHLGLQLVYGIAPLGWALWLAFAGYLMGR